MCSFKSRKTTDFVVRKGGIAIAGPGGVATAYTGGTAIVGPYGTVYKTPQATAILGPHSKVINITDDVRLEDIIKMHNEKQNSNFKSSSSKLQTEKPEENNYKNYKNFFSYSSNQPIKIAEFKSNRKNYRSTTVKNRSTVIFQKENAIRKTIENVMRIEQRNLTNVDDEDFSLGKKNETSLIFRPKSKAEAGKNGVAISVPSSHAYVFPGQKTNIFFQPESVASAGPNGFAHALSDLHVSYLSNDTTTISSLVT